MMVSFLLLGFFIGMSHALEADHLAAVSAIATSDHTSRKRLAALGASWGIGHSTTLLLMSFVVLVFGYVFTARMTAGLEFVVGVMLVLLGTNVLWKLRRQKVHFHVHQHGDGNKHFHAHSHGDAKVGHRQDPHEHGHGFSLRAYLIGLVHGAAGSAGLVALTAAATHDLWTAAGYILLFAAGSILGMAILTYAASWPLRLTRNTATGLFRAVQMSIACAAIYLGSTVIAASGPIIWGSA